MQEVVREHRDDLILRIRVLAALVVGLLAVIGAGYWYVQLVRGDEYRRLADENRLRKLFIQAPRGLIYDRRKRLLVENIPSYNLMLDRSRSQNVEKALGFAAEVLGRRPEDLLALLDRYRSVPAFTPVLVAENLTLPQVSRVGALSFEYPELEVEVQHLRLYRHGAQTAAFLGYVGEATQQEIDAADGAYKVGDLVGKKGIEHNIEY